MSLYKSMRKLILLLTIWIGVCDAVSQAEIAFYSGTGRFNQLRATDVGVSKPIGVILVVDFTAEQFSIIGTARVNGQNRYNNIAGVAVGKILSMSSGGARPVRYTTIMTQYGATAQAFYITIFLSGQDSTFELGAVTPSIVPRVLTGEIVSIQDTGSPNTLRVPMTVSLLLPQSRSANAQSQDFTTALNSVGTYLQSIGYVQGALQE